MTVLKQLAAGGRRKVLFLGYGPAETGLIEQATKRQVDVWHTRERLEVDFLSAFDVIVSYGYRYILTPTLIERSPAIVNLHISYLPFNRGAHPNYWAFVDGTSHGVNIHLIDSGIDTGPILFQRKVTFSPEEDTFSKAYRRLIKEVEGLFLENLDDLLFKPLKGRLQGPGGSFHKVSDLPTELSRLGYQDRRLARTAQVAPASAGSKTIPGPARVP